MNNKDRINKLIDEAVNSTEGVRRAAPMPFLQTRINARLNNKNENIWERVSRFISRPSIAITGLMVIILLNVLVMVFNSADLTTSATEQPKQNGTDEFAFTVTAIYDFENIEP
jgi:hypothetical protein